MPRLDKPNQGEIGAVVAAFNAQQGTPYKLIRKLPTGTNGAWLVSDNDGIGHIFKWVSTKDIRADLVRAAAIAHAVDTPATPTPDHEALAYLPQYGTAYVQQYLDGVAAPFPTTRVVNQLIKLSEGFRNRAQPGSADLSAQVRDTVLHDAQGWQAAIAKFSPDGRELVSEFEQLVAPYRTFRGRTTDIVHGDFTHHNALVDDPATDRLTGYIDWETAGRGDRGYDQARLLFDVYVSGPELGHTPEPEAVRALTDKIIESSGVAGLTVYMAYWALQVAEFGVNGHPKKAPMFIEVGRDVIMNLKEVAARTPGIAL
jgi:Phosphotransferase enzyme family